MPTGYHKLDGFTPGLHCKRNDKFLLLFWSLCDSPYLLDVLKCTEHYCCMKTCPVTSFKIVFVASSLPQDGPNMPRKKLVPPSLSAHPHWTLHTITTPQAHLAWRATPWDTATYHRNPPRHTCPHMESTEWFLEANPTSSTGYKEVVMAFLHYALFVRLPELFLPTKCIHDSNLTIHVICCELQDRCVWVVVKLL